MNEAEDSFLIPSSDGSSQSPPIASQTTPTSANAAVRTPIEGRGISSGLWSWSVPMFCFFSMSMFIIDFEGIVLLGGLQKVETERPIWQTSQAIHERLEHLGDVHGSHAVPLSVLHHHQRQHRAATAGAELESLVASTTEEGVATPDPDVASK
ncbi:hypothetical protein CYMTET_25778, partial [Cymbomonas tetramitiformis]